MKKTNAMKQEIVSPTLKKLSLNIYIHVIYMISLFALCLFSKIALVLLLF